MKKRVLSLISIVTVFALFLCGCSTNKKDSNVSSDKTESVTSNFVSDDNDIDSKIIASRTIYNEITNAINLRYVENNFPADEASNQYSHLVLPTEETAVKYEIYTDMAIIEKCKEYNILLSKEEASKGLKEEFELSKSNVSNKSIYDDFLDDLSKHKISEDDYLEMMADDAYYEFNKTMLSGYFRDNIFETESYSDELFLTESHADEIFLTEFNKYVKEITDDYKK